MFLTSFLPLQFYAMIFDRRRREIASSLENEPISTAFLRKGFLHPKSLGRRMETEFRTVIGKERAIAGSLSRMVIRFEPAAHQLILNKETVYSIFASSIANRVISCWFSTPHSVVFAEIPSFPRLISFKEQLSFFHLRRVERENMKFLGLKTHARVYDRWGSWKGSANVLNPLPQNLLWKREADHQRNSTDRRRPIHV